MHIPENALQYQEKYTQLLWKYWLDGYQLLRMGGDFMEDRVHQMQSKG
jgi:hypothetical protein